MAFDFSNIVSEGNPLGAILGFAKTAVDYFNRDDVFTPTSQFYLDNPQESPQFGAVAPTEDWISSGILDAPTGSAFVDLSTLQPLPPAQNVPGPPTGPGSSEIAPPSLPPAALAPLPWEFAGSGLLSPSAGIVIKLPSARRRPLTTKQLGTKLAKKLTTDALKKLGVKGALARVGGQFLGPVGIIGTTIATTPGVWSGVLKASKAAGDVVADTLGKIPALFGGPVLSPGSGLEPIKVPGSYKPDVSARGSVIEGDVERMRRTVQEARRGVYERTMRKFPAQPASAPAGRKAFSQVAATRAKQIGALLDALKKRQAGKAVGAVAAIATPLTPPPSSAIAPPIGSTLYSPGYRLSPSPQLATAKKACDCSQCGKKKRGRPRRKCLQRAAVAFTAGARAGKHAGTKCVRWEGGKSR